MLRRLKEWKVLPLPSILGVLGPALSRDSWVTEFSLDMINASRIENKLTVFALCDRPYNHSYTSFDIVKIMICQLVEQQPKLCIDRADIFSKRIFGRVQNFNHACQLLDTIVARLPSLTLLIDRVDRVKNDHTANNLIGFLSDLVGRYQRKVQIIITSADRPSKQLLRSTPMTICMISTRSRPGRKQEYYVKSASASVVFTLSHEGKEISRAKGARGYLELRRFATCTFDNWSISWLPFRPRTPLEKRLFF
jgi:hypothetical protein